MFCPFCGARIPPGANQCPRCQKRLRKESNNRPSLPNKGELAFLYAQEARPTNATSSSTRAIRLWKWGLIVVAGLYLAFILILTILAIRGGLAERHRLQGTIGPALGLEYRLPG